MSEVKADVTGTVMQIKCSVGETVAKGDTMVVMESMKMEIPHEAAADGTVSEIRCEEGQPVSEGDVLVVLT